MEQTFIILDINTILMDHKMKIFLKALILTSFIFASAVSLNAGNRARGEIVFFPAYTGNAVADVILKTTTDRLHDACTASGRFIPAEYNSVQSVFRGADGNDRYDLYRNTAVSLGADVYAVITLYGEGRGFRAVVELFPVGKEFKDKGFKYSVSAGVAENIPLKAAKQFALRLKDFSVSAKILERRSDGSFLISAGQWHGLEEGEYGSSCGNIKIHNITRYTSTAEGGGITEGSLIFIEAYPENDLFISIMDRQILENIVRRYGTDEILQKRKGSGQELILATCLVNQGASFCLPGYGSFLSVEYLGIENGVPDRAAIGFTAFLTAAHFLLPSTLTGFEINFFPWERDNDKSAAMQRFQYFLWATVPLTFTVSFYSQLACQYREKNMLPPLFAEYNTTAALLSLFIPGGGLFYKGYRGAGWGFYAGEMSLAGCAVYMYGSRNGSYCIAAFAALKAVDILAAAILDPSYKFFREEAADTGKSLNFAAAFIPEEGGTGEFVMSVTKKF